VLETNREDEQNRETKSPTLLTHMQNQPWTKENNTRRRPKENSSRGQDGVKKDQAGARSSDLCAGRRRRNSLSLLCCVGRKGSSGRTAGSSGGRRGEDGIAAEPENPKNSAEKEFPGAEGGDLNKRHS